MEPAPSTPQGSSSSPSLPQTEMRRVLFSLVVAAWLVMGSPAALADPPGPTDYQSAITSIEPPVAGITLSIVGGDSFVVLDVASGHEVFVIGYRGEQYLRFDSDGSVAVNTRSPSHYLNNDRFGAAVVPAEADAAAEPVWVPVADDGSYAWHDHRTHWMNTLPPPGLGPGDQVAEGVVPLVVDGVEVDVTVQSYWLSGPSRVPVFGGIAIGLVAAVAIGRHGRRAAAVLAALATGALFIGSVAFWSVPGETGPAWSLWALPATSLLAALAATGSGGPGRWRVRLYRNRAMLQLTAALELVAWSWLHRQWLWRAIIPTAAPFWLDRMVAAATMAGALGAVVTVVMAAAGASGGVTEPRRGPRR